jgi:hypothetical protein
VGGQGQLLDTRSGAAGIPALFDAQWIYRSPSLQRPDGRIAGIWWTRVDRAAALTDWEAAWSGEARAEHGRIFLPGLLANEDIAVIAAYRDQRIVAGAIANRTADVVGLSNVFVPALDGGRFWAGCVAAAVDAFPHLPLVGYEADRALAMAHALGFQTLGPLRVWVWPNQATPLVG